MIQAENIDEVVKALKKEAVELEGNGKLAERVKTSLPYLRMVLRKERPPTPSMLDLIGYKLYYKKTK
jgi:hypothetical protein